MRSIQSGKVSWGVPGNRGAFLSPRRAHLLTTAPKGAAVVLPSAAVRSTRWTRLLREPMDNVTLPWESLSLSTQLAAALQGSIRQLPAQTCHRQLCRSYGYRRRDAHFLFHKKKQKRERRDGENEWRSIIWKQRSSAGARDDLPALLPLT